MTTYNFVSSNTVRPFSTCGYDWIFTHIPHTNANETSFEFELLVRQQPERAKVCTARERERHPVDPPSIVQLCITSAEDRAQSYLHNPFVFMCVELLAADGGSKLPSTANSLAGTTVSSLYRLKDVDNSDGGFFVFGDISVKIEGFFKLKFSLFEIVTVHSQPNASAPKSSQQQEVNYMKSVVSRPFQVYSAKGFPGMAQSTVLSRRFSDQGVRIRIRKEHRMQIKKARIDDLPLDRAESVQIHSVPRMTHPGRSSSSTPADLQVLLNPADRGQHSQHVSRSIHQGTNSFHPYQQATAAHSGPPSSSSHNPSNHDRFFRQANDTATWPSRPIQLAPLAASPPSAWGHTGTGSLHYKSSESLRYTSQEHLNSLPPLLYRSTSNADMSGHNPSHGSSAPQHSSSNIYTRPSGASITLPPVANQRFTSQPSNLLPAPTFLSDPPRDVRAILLSQADSARGAEETFSPNDSNPSNRRDMLQYTGSSPKAFESRQVVPHLSHSTSTASTIDSFFSSERGNTSGITIARHQSDSARGLDQVSFIIPHDSAYTQSLRLAPLQHDYSQFDLPAKHEVVKSPLSPARILEEQDTP